MLIEVHSVHVDEIDLMLGERAVDCRLEAPPVPAPVGIADERPLRHGGREEFARDERTGAGRQQTSAGLRRRARSPARRGSSPRRQRRTALPGQMETPHLGPSGARSHLFFSFRFVFFFVQFMLGFAPQLAEARHGHAPRVAVVKHGRSRDGVCGVVQKSYWSVRVSEHKKRSWRRRWAAI